MSGDGFSAGWWGWAILGASVASIAIAAVRNLICVIQLAVAAYVFRTRARPAPRSRELWSRYAELAPPVSVIAPAYNEELSIVDAVRALLALEYPEHEVIVVNDGSTDRTLAALIAAFDMRPAEREQIEQLQQTRIVGVYDSVRFPNLLVVDKENGRKADATNAGIGFATTPLICVIDADSVIEPDGLLRATEPFLSDDGSLVAVGGAIRIINGCAIHEGSIARVGIPDTLIPRFQVVEYMRAFLAARVAMARLDMLMLISGAFGIFRRSVLVEIGGYRHDTLGEDLELLTRLHRHLREQGRRYRVDFVPEVVCWTEAPVTLQGLRAQRARWEQGALETIARHRRMILNPRYGRAGMVAMPLIVLEDVIGPPLELIGYLVIPVGYALGILSLPLAGAFFGLTLLFGTALSLGALALEESQLRRTPSARDLLQLAIAAMIENFGYRQVNLLYRLYGMVRHFRRDTSWQTPARIGFNRQ